METQNQSLAVMKPEELSRRDTDIAGLCRAIVVKTACEIQGRKYVKVEGWQSIATAHGCVAGCRDVERITGGFRAIGELRNISTNQVIATAEGFVGEDEPTWFGGDNGRGKTLPKRPDYAIRAMCQTRAISRVCRSAFAHVVVLMDAGLSTTPAEEVPDGGFNDQERPPARQESNQPQSATKPAPTRPRPSGGEIKGNVEELEFVQFVEEKKTSKQGKSYNLWTAEFKTDSDSQLFAGTIHREIGSKLEAFKAGELVSVTTQPGKFKGTWELLDVAFAGQIQ